MGVAIPLSKLPSGIGTLTVTPSNSTLILVVYEVTVCWSYPLLVQATRPPRLTVTVEGRKSNALDPGKLKAAGSKWATSFMLMLGWLLAALTGLAKKSTTSRLAAGRILIARKYVRRGWFSVGL